MPAKTPPRARVRLVDVAERANVSVATASRALNGVGELSDETRRVVVQAAADLGFRPSPLARSLRTHRSHLVGLVVPHVEHAFYAALVKGAQAYLEPVGYKLLLVDSGEAPDSVAAAIQTLRDQHVDGLLVSTTPFGPERFRAELGGTPCVFIDELVDDVGVGSVGLENAAGIELLVDHVVEHGHRRIGFLGGPRDRTDGRERHAGFVAAMARHGLEPVREAVLECTWELPSGYDAARAVLDLPEPPSALVTASVEIAMGVMTAARSRGLRIPRDIALATFDDAFFAPLLDVPLTAIAYDSVAMGATSAELLVRALEAPGEQLTDEHRMPVSLVRRRSCGCEYEPTDELREGTT